jgi:hypothetical protein
MKAISRAGCLFIGVETNIGRGIGDMMKSNYAASEQMNFIAA